MHNTLQKIHRWIGLPLGLLFVITFGTGFLNALDELLGRATDYSQFEYRASTISDTAEALTRITSKGTKGIRRIVMPSRDKPYFEVFMRQQTAIYPIQFGSDSEAPEKLVLKKQEGGFFKTVLGLHRNFLLGRDGLLGIEGADYVAWVSLLALGISCLGLWLWWPLRKAFKVKNILPRDTKRKSFFYSHMTSGVVTLLLVVVMSLTGASITYREITQQLLGVESSGKVRAAKGSNQQNATENLESLENNWESWLRASSRLMPHGTLATVNFPRRQSELITLNYLKSGDWLSLPNNKVQLHQTKSVIVNVQSFQDFTLGQKLYSVLKPLHTGSNLPFAYVVLLLVMSLIGTAMVFSGVVSFVLKLLPKKSTRKIFKQKTVKQRA